MRRPPRKLQFAVNRHLIDKHEAGDKNLFVSGFENREATLDELADCVTRGSAYCAQLKGPRRATNFLACDIVSIDIDHGMTVEQALAHPLVRDHGAFVYTTVNHAPDAHRFRAVFVLPRTITDAKEMRAVQRSLALRLNGDPSATDAARIFFGNRRAQVYTIGKVMSDEILDDLIAQSRHAREGGPGGVLKATRSAMPIDLDQPVRLAGGHVMPFRLLGADAKVHCPFHNDVHASAFVCVGENGGHGLHCSACSTTYWPAGGAADFDFFDFDKAVRRVAEHFARHHDFGPMGPYLNSPDAKLGLLGCNIEFSRHDPAPAELKPGLTLIKAPKGSGKTASLTRLIKGKRKIILVGSRRSLIRQSCSRLLLSCYLEDQGDILRVGVCVNSLPFVGENIYDVVILDEVEQVLAHFLADTIDQRDSDARAKLFERFRELVRRAKYVIALDADLGWVTFDTLARMMDIPDAQADLFDKRRPAARLWVNTRKPGEGKTINISRSKSRLVAELVEAAAAGKQVYATANSKRLVERLAGTLAVQLPAVRQLLITADTVGGEAQRAFLEAPHVEALKYNVILTSPAVGTGVDITFPGNAQEINSVVAFCEPGITTHQEFDQQMSRVRHPGEVRAWVSPRRFHFETSVDVVRRDLLEQEMGKYLLVDQNASAATGCLALDDALVEMAALIVSQRRASMNALRSNFIAHKREQGFEIVEVDAADEDAAGAALLRLGKDFGDAKHRARMLAAPPLQPSAYQEAKVAIEGGRVVSEDTVWSVRRTAVELFYRRPITPQLLELDDRGRYRGAVSLLDQVERAGGAPEGAHQPLDIRLRFVRERHEVPRALGQILRLTPLLRGGAWDAGVVIDGDDLVDFARFARRNKAELENLLGVEIRRDVAEKPISQLGSMLRMIGLGLEKAGTIKRNGRKVYRYQLDGGRLQRIKAVQADRERTTAWRFMAQLHGWPAENNKDDDEEHFNDAA